MLIQKTLAELKAKLGDARFAAVAASIPPGPQGRNIATIQACQAELAKDAAPAPAPATKPKAAPAPAAKAQTPEVPKTGKGRTASTWGRTQN